MLAKIVVIYVVLVNKIVGPQKNSCVNFLWNFVSELREGWGYQIGWIFRIAPKGGGVIFNPNICITDFGNFLIMKLMQSSNFRVQGMFFSTTVLRKIKTRHTLVVTLAVTSLRDGSHYQIVWIFGKLCCNFFYNGYGCIYARRYEGQIVWNACICLLQSVTWFYFKF